MPKPQPREILDKVQDALKRVRIIPSGADDPLPPVPDVVEVSEDDLDVMSDAWDETMPDYAGLLDAEVINRQNA